MKLKYILTVLLIIWASTAYSQTNYLGFSYSMSVPLGGIENYISAGSFRGANLDGIMEVNEKYAVGFALGWNTFFEKRINETFNKDNYSLTGTQYRYLNAFPILVRGMYEFGAQYGIRPYAGAGLGLTGDISRTDVGLYSFKKTAFHFTMAPELGIIIPVNEGSVTANIRYVYGVKARDLDHISYLSFSLGYMFGN